MKWAWQLQEVEQIAPTAHHVLLALADRYNAGERAAWPSYADLMKRTGLSERGVRNAIATLEERGIVRRGARVSRKGRKLGNLYRFPLLDPEYIAERQSYDFDEHGHYDDALARENLEEMGNLYDVKDDPWAS
jgi:DNA-binding Lrp family transcriptional regulator